MTTQYAPHHCTVPCQLEQHTFEYSFASSGKGMAADLNAGVVHIQVTKAVVLTSSTFQSL